jgi:hypothetical protein
MPDPAPGLPARRPAPRLCKVFIAATTFLWFASLLWFLSDRSGGFLGNLATFFVCLIALLIMIVTWLGIFAYTLIWRRPLGLLGSFLPIAAVVLAIAVPWSRWIFDTQFAAAEPDLRTFAQSQPDLPASGTRVIEVHGFQFVSVTRTSNAVFLTQARSPDGEFGLVFSPSGSLPSAPDWAKHYGYTRVAPDWWKYHWSND